MKQKREREKSDADDADAFIEAAQSTATLYTIAFFFSLFLLQLLASLRVAALFSPIFPFDFNSTRI